MSARRTPSRHDRVRAAAHVQSTHVGASVVEKNNDLLSALLRK